MHIIEQTDDHAAAIERLLDLTFGPDRHHKTVYRLRDGVAPAPGLSFVIENGDGPNHNDRADSPGRRIAEGDSTRPGSGLAATLRFWPVMLPDGGAALLLGPIAVRPDLAGRGYGKALMRHGIARARVRGWPAILLVGDAPYYQPLGFTRAAAEKLQLPGPVERERFLALELVPGALDGAEGMVGRAEPDAAAQRKAGG